MLDLVWFILWCMPIVTGLLFVLLSLKDRSRAAVVLVKSRQPASPKGPQGR